MTGYSFADDLLGGGQPPQAPAVVPVQATPKAFNFAGSLLGEEPKPAPAQKPLDKDLIDDPSKALGFKGQAVGSFASDDKEWVRNAAHYLYPEQPIDEAIKRFGQTKEGRWYHKDDEGRLLHVTPFSGMARLNNIGGGVGKAIPVATGTAAGIVTAPMAATGIGLAGTLTATGTAAAGGEVLRQIIGDWLLGEASTKDLNGMNVAKEGIEGGLGQGIGLGMGAWLSRNAVPDIGHYSQSAMNRLMDTAERYGIRLTPGEASNLASMIAEQKRLQGVPQSANIMRNFSQERNREVVDAFNSYLNRIGQGRDPAALGRAAGTVADDALTAAQTARTNAVNPLYQQAEQQIQRVDASNVLQYIDQQLVHAKGPIQRALQTAREYLTIPDPNGGRARIADESFQGLNNAKMAIDSLMDPDMAMRQGIDRNAMRELVTVRDRLVQAIDNAAGNNGAYQQGRQTYQTLTEQQVQPLQEALRPLLNANRETANLSSVAQNLFGSNRSPDQIAAARQIMEQRAPEVWNSLVRQFVREEAAVAMKTMADGELRNVAGGLSKRLGDEFTSANLRAAMSPTQFREYQDLMDVFRAAARAMDANSDTAFKQEMIKRAKNAAGGTMARVTRNLNPAKLVENASDFFANRNYDRQAEAIANIITSGDRQAINRLRQLRQLDAGDWRRYAILGAVLEKTGAFAAEKALD
jgi:hypothetical protein